MKISLQGWHETQLRKLVELEGITATQLIKRLVEQKTNELTPKEDYNPQG